MCIRDSRITFDYKAKMPEKALLVGVGDGNQRAVDGKVSYTGYNYFQACLLYTSRCV